MIDNGLLKYYPTFASKQGFVKMRAMKYQFVRPEYYDIVKKYICQDGTFYFKSERQDEIDSQVLLSQIYKKSGVNSAIYLPALDPLNHRGTISNDIESPSTISGKDFFSLLYQTFPKELIDTELIKHTKSNATSSKVQSRDKLMMFDRKIVSPSLKDFEEQKTCENFDFVSLFTKDGMRAFIKMHLFDTASFNVDRNSSNFYFEIDKNGKICGVTTIDHSMSQDACLYGLSEFYNFLGEACETDKAGMLYELKENETVQDFILPQEMAEEIGSINVVSVAQEIKQETGYKINQNYVNCLAHSYENLAEDLVK